jgi:uncharacterized protein YqjF (DUF2071 family)
LHFEVEKHLLQSAVPFELDRWEGRAFVSVVAFEMERLRPAFGGGRLAWVLRPMATHPLLNVRTYVRPLGETGIYFLAEFLPNWLSRIFGRPFFGLPYHLARASYQHSPEAVELTGHVSRQDRCFAYRAQPVDGAVPGACAAGSCDEFLLERYTCFTEWIGIRRFFRIWHPAWLQVACNAEVCDSSLLAPLGPWAAGLRLTSAHYSPGFSDVWMGCPHLVGRTAPAVAVNS